ncbi:hypothetical protein Agub_g794 [Astrephomene gubernaculifera]|uniref:Uncharacterized protein n=1 Tax=Astrephomene gubernaculifera TaxID=47775 RepID=A0AAD3DE90_9CHLO|nr:hypothetical protein Agub_g794 [Astrephomene gubernaculifera]
MSYAAAAAAAHDEVPDPVTGQGAVDPSLKMEFRKLTSHLVKYIEKAHRLTLAGIVVEWVRDAYGKIYLLSVLRTEWASNACGNGGGSLSAANLLEEPQEVEETGPAATANSIISLANGGTGNGGAGSGGGASGGGSGMGDLGMPPPPPPLPPSLEPGGDMGPAVAWSAAGGAANGTSATATTASPPTTIYAPPPPGVTLTPSTRSGLVLLPSGTGRPTSAYPGAASSPVSELLRPPGVPGMGAGSTMSALAAFPGGSRSAGLNVSVSNSWPSHQHDAQLGSPGARAAGAGSPANAPGSGYRPLSGSLSSSQLLVHPQHHPHHSHHLLQHSLSSSGHAPQQHHPHVGRIQSARPALTATPAFTTTDRTVIGNNSHHNGARPPRPGSSPVAFGRNSNTSPLRSNALVPGPQPGVISSTGHMDRAASPSAAAIAAAAAAAAAASVGANSRTASPSRSRPATGTSAGAGGSGATGHVNAGTRGAPLMMQQLTRDLEAARDQLVMQHQLAEASAAKVRQLEREKELLVAAFDQRVSELQSSLMVARQDLSAARADAEEQRRRATESEARVTELEQRTQQLQSTLDGERGTVMTALRECHERDVSGKHRNEQLEAEVLRLTERLKEESTAVAALKRQLLQFSDIAERYATTLREGEMEPGMQEVLDRVQKLFVGQTNPFGESYAVQKVLNHYHGDLRAVFLYYAQLENNFAAYWPPGLAFQQWMLFCKETETSDPRSNSRVSIITQPHKMLHPRDCEVVFRAYAKVDPNAINTSAPVLSYEGFLCALIDVAFRVKRLDQPYLSEAVREYILSYVSRASKMSPSGLRRGQVRDALEGTREGPPPTPGVLSASGKAMTGVGGKGKKKATIAAGAAKEGTGSPGMAGTAAAAVVAAAAAAASAGQLGIRTTTGTPAGGSLAASRPGSALSRKSSMLIGAIEQDLAIEVNAALSRMNT